MFPILALAGAALAGSALTGTAVSSAVVGTAAIHYRKRKKLQKKAEEDINTDFEAEFIRRRTRALLRGNLPAHAKAQVRKNLKEELKAIDEGFVDLSRQPWDETWLPKKLLHLKGDYILGNRDEMVFYLALLHEQVKHQAGPVGEMLLKLSKKSGIPYGEIYRTLFEDSEMNASLIPAVEALRVMSRRRDTPEFKKREEAAKREKQKHR
jgi:hypothetical protein